jgi:hypothetical protein
MYFYAGVTGDASPFLYAAAKPQLKKWRAKQNQFLLTERRSRSNVSVNQDGAEEIVADSPQFAKLNFDTH